MNPNRKIGIISVWIGPLPSYFPLWVRSLEKNHSFDFLLFTDQLVATDKPDNLKIFNLSFQDLKNLISGKLSLDIDIERPYKLCDFRPAYGEIFADHLEGYDFWGSCDIDLLFGDLKKFITEDLLISYKKIFSRGHLTLFRNEPAINAAYRSSLSVDYKRIFRSPGNFAFDEWSGIHRIFEELGIDQYNEQIMADLKVNSARLVCSNLQNFADQIFVWQEGDARQYYVKDGKLGFKELAYIHFQKRKIAFPDARAYSSGSLILNPQSILPYHGTISAATVKKYDRSNYGYYIQMQIKRAQKAFSRLKRNSPEIVKDSR